MRVRLLKKKWERSFPHLQMEVILVGILIYIVIVVAEEEVVVVVAEEGTVIEPGLNLDSGFRTCYYYY